MHQWSPPNISHWKCVLIKPVCFIGQTLHQIIKIFSQKMIRIFFLKGGGGVKTCRFIIQLKTCNFDIQVRMSFLFKTKKENFQCNSYMYKNIE